MAELRKCPFCGGESEILKYPRCERKYVVVCKNNLCNASIGQYSTSKENAVRAWNTRKPMEEMVAELEDAYYEFYSMEQHDKENPFNEGLLEGYKRTLEIVRGKE